MSTREQILQAIKDFYTKNGYSPSVTELANIVGLKSPSTVHGHLHRMRRDGLINFVDGEARTITVVGGCPVCGRLKEEGNE